MRSPNSSTLAVMEKAVEIRGSVALIVGVTGMVGLSLAEALKKPMAEGGRGPWKKVYGAARRPMPTWFPTSTIDEYISFDATDYEDTLEKLSPLSTQVTNVFWVALQVEQSEESNVFTNTSMLQNVINVLLKSSKSPSIRHLSLQTGTQYYMGPKQRETVSHENETPFVEDLPRLPCKNFYYPLEDLVASYPSIFTYSIHRTSIIIGASSRSFYNSLLTLSAYATICKHQALPFRYFGSKYTWEHFCDMSDARVIAEQHIWASVTDGAKKQAFNCTNGDVFTWKGLWKILCDIFDVEFVPFDDAENGKFDIVEEMKSKKIVWEAIVEQHGLYETNLDEIACFGALKNVLHFDFQHVSSMNKSREFGFFGYADTFKSIKMWVEKLRDMKIIP